MASKKTVTIDNLVALGPERLATILVKLAKDAKVKRRLRLELAAEGVATSSPLRSASGLLP